MASSSARGERGALQQAYSIGPAPPPETRRLHLNEFRFAHSDAVIGALKAPCEAELTQYQSGPLNALRDELAQYVGAPSAANILITPGSDDALRAAIDTSTLRQHTAVIAGTPGYTHFEHYCRLKPLRMIQYAIGLCTSPSSHAASLRYFSDELRAGCLVYLCSPNNPTGDLWNPDTVAGFAAAYPRSLFLIDEAYVEFAAADVPQDTIMDELWRVDSEDAYKRLNEKSCASVAVAFENVVVTRTFSKAFGLAAQRVGYAVGSPKLIAELGIAVSPKAFGPAACDLALTVLRSANHYWRAALTLKLYEGQVVDALRQKGWTVYDTPGNYYLLYAGPGNAAKNLTATLAVRGIAIRDRDSLPGLAGFVRITSGDDADFRSIMEVFGDISPPTERPPQALYTEKGRVAAIKLLMRNSLRILKDGGLIVWAQGGTMLGVQRHAGMIPTDDDGDLAYERTANHDPAAALVDAFKQKGLTLQRNRTDAYWQIGTNATGETISAVHIDLFSYTNIAGRFILDDPRFANEEPDSKQAHCNTSYAPEELYPLKEGSFYDMQINMPAQSDKVLKRSLGDDYMQVMRVRQDNGPPVVVQLRDYSPA